MSTAVRIENLAKQYRIGSVPTQYGRLSEAITDAVLRRRRDRSDTGGERELFWALEDVSFEVDEGEVVGIVGRNGAGKTTLLKILSRITEPTKGMAEINGRVGALLEVGTGFHPELTGRENIALNGAILGMGRNEVRAKFEEIVDFAEVERFIDTPVKRYSSGMYVRLAFAVAASLEPEILIIDEVLAVGDSRFQKKCLGRMTEVAREGRTVLFVSHNTGAVAELCTRAVLLDGGRKLVDGSVSNVLDAYARLSGNDAQAVELPVDPSLVVSVTSVSVESSVHGRTDVALDLADDIVIVVDYTVAERVSGFQISLTLSRNAIDTLHTFDTDHLEEVPDRAPGRYRARCLLPGMFLKGGLYSVRVSTGTPAELFQEFDSVVRFEIEDRSINTHGRGYRRDRPGHVISPGRWEDDRVG